MTASFMERNKVSWWIQGWLIEALLMWKNVMNELERTLPRCLCSDAQKLDICRNVIFFPLVVTEHCGKYEMNPSSLKVPKQKLRSFETIAFLLACLTSYPFFSVFLSSPQRCCVTAVLSLIPLTPAHLCVLTPSEDTQAHIGICLCVKPLTQTPLTQKHQQRQQK